MQTVTGRGVQFVCNDALRKGLETLASLFYGTDAVLGDLDALGEFRLRHRRLRQHMGEHG